MAGGGKLVPDARKKSVIKAIVAHDRAFAHGYLFGHRHEHVSPSYHLEIINLWHSARRKLVFLVFRGGAKSTISEEAFIVGALFQDFRNGFILGVNEKLAAERLQAIKYELEGNPRLSEVFGQLMGPIWHETKIVLANGVCIQALGSGQSMRGTKHLQWRPDCLLVDDVEGDGDTQTPDQRSRTRSWFFSVVLPALAPQARIRVTATPLDRDALPLELSRLPGWHEMVVPIKYLDAVGSFVSAWPERYPLDWIDAREEEYRRAGQLAEFRREYMCEAVVESERTFKPEMFKNEVAQIGFNPVYVMYDPARTHDRSKSDQTGKAVWSWVSGRLLIWESGGYFWSPDEIIEDIFRTAQIYHPVLIGIEKTGLDEFLEQPLRQKMVSRGELLPLSFAKAPRSKIDFIKGLQPFFAAGEVAFIGEAHADLKEQLLNFPRGHDDIPNALAYALLLRPAAALYPEFLPSLIGAAERRASERIWVIFNCDARYVTAQVVQFYSGRIKLLFDDCLEGARSVAAADLCRKIALEFGGGTRALAPPRHFRPHDVLGLRPALLGAKLIAHQGGELNAGREELRRLLRMERIEIGLKASWTIRALQGGATVESVAGDDDPYFLFAEGLESFCGRLTMLAEEADNKVRIETTRDGREYISSRP